MIRVNWRLTLERIETDDNDNILRRREIRQVVTDDMLHKSVAEPEQILGPMARDMYREVVDNKTKETP